MKKTLILLPLLLAACGEMIKSEQLPYEYSWKEVKPSHFEAVMEGDPGVEVKELKAAFKTKGTALCTGKVYLLRGMRESYNDSNNSYVLKGLIDCVDMDYFSS